MLNAWTKRVDEMLAKLRGVSGRANVDFYQSLRFTGANDYANDLECMRRECFVICETLASAEGYLRVQVADPHNVTIELMSVVEELESLSTELTAELEKMEVLHRLRALAAGR